MYDIRGKGPDMRYIVNLADGVIHDVKNAKQSCCVDKELMCVWARFQFLKTAISAGFEPCPCCIQDKIIKGILVGRTDH